MRRWILAALLVLVLAAPAGAVFTDQEPTNDAIATAPILFNKTGPVTTIGGKLALVAGDIDFLGITALSAGDIVTVSVTPLEDPPNLENPDTMVGLFDSTGVILCQKDQASNNTQSEFPPGSGSLCRFSITAAGDYYVGVTGVTGFSDTPFDGAHSEDGAYEVTISVYAGSAPTPTPTPIGTPTATPTPTPTATPTPEPGAMLQLVAGGVGLAFLNKRRLRKNRRAQPTGDTDRSSGGA
jgi:hypothetical protein